MNSFKSAIALMLILLFAGLDVRARVSFPLVGISSASAVVQSNQVVVRWQSLSDFGIVYFDLYRCATNGQQWIKVNADDIVSSNSMTGGSYEVLDPAAIPFRDYLYRLVQTDQNGNLRVGRTYQLKSVPEIAVAEKTSAVVQTAIPQVGLFVPATGGVRPMGVSSLSVLDGTTFVKITTTNYGLQYVSATNLATLLGQPVVSVQAAIAQGLFRLTVSGQPVTYLFAPDTSNLLFYAEAHKDNYSTNNIYWLTSQTNGTVGFQNGQSPAPTNNSIWYPAVQNYWKDSIYKPNLLVNPEDDPWMWQLLKSGFSGYDTFTDSIVIDHLSQGTNRAAQISINLWGGVDNVTHIVQLALGSTNNIMGQQSWYGITQTNAIISISSTSLVSGANNLILKAIYNNGPIHSLWYLNSFTLSYPRTYTALNGLIDFTANSNAVITVDGFTSTNITLLDVTNPKQPMLVTNLTIDQPASTYRVSFVPAGPAAHCVAYQSGAAAPVMSLVLAYTGGFSASSNAADYVIVSATNLLVAATNLAAYRQQTGFKTIIAPLDQVYNEFGYGFPTPHAIQSLLATAWTNWATPPRYMILLGKGTFDYRDIYQAHENLMPPLMVSTPFGVYATDSLMGDVNGDNLPEVAVGRLSGLTTNDIFNLINKIKAYESFAPPTTPKALLIADYPDTAGVFPNDISYADAILTNKFTDTILLSTNSLELEPLHSMILTNWQQGVDFVNYAGEGASSSFGNSGYLSISDVTNALIINSNRMPMIAAITCIAGNYSYYYTYCLGEYLVQPTNGGAIAFFGSSGLSLDGEASELNVRLTTLLRANAKLCLGDMIRQAMSDHISLDSPSVPPWIYNLLGDPALHYNLVRDVLSAPSLHAANVAYAVTVTNTVLGGNTAYYQVAVPSGAVLATNRLVFATNLPVNLLFNLTNFPTGGGTGDFTLLSHATSGVGSPVLATNTVPPLASGSTYFLGVQNTNSTSVSFALEVDFLLTASAVSLPAQGNQLAGVSSIVLVTNTATDSYTNAVLTYLLTSPPVGAFISSNGIISWTNAAPAGSAQRFTTVVTDNGVPPAAATNTFTVFVAPFPAITNVFVTATNMALQWFAPTNDQFQVQWTTNLAAADWVSVPGIITSASGVFVFTETNSPPVMKFYRLQLLP